MTETHKPTEDTAESNPFVGEPTPTPAPAAPATVDTSAILTAAPATPPPAAAVTHIPEPDFIPPPPPTSEPPAQHERESPVSPQVAALRGMFPDFDDAVLQSVLESVGGDQDRAIDTLLGMSDPEYRPESRPAEPQLTQTELDEQMARQLVAEDEQRHQQRYLAQQRPYEPRESRQWQPQPGQPQQQQQQPGGNDAIADLTEQFNKMAETGKKTFGNLFSKVKAKINEMDQSRQNQGSSSADGTQPQWGGSGNYQQQPPPQPQRPYYEPQAQPPPQVNPPTRSAPVQGYDAVPAPAVNATSHPTYAPETTPLSRERSPEGTGTPAPPSTSQGAPIDGGKLGLLPKRPVSLLRPDTGSGAPVQRRHSDDDDDDLEYVENPFEDNRK